MKTKFKEFQLDGLIGPTHHFAGHSSGNQASMLNKGKGSHPKKAALQGLEKAYFVSQFAPQLVLPPIQRPILPNSLKELKLSEDLYSASMSASSMWVANSGTFSPSCDTRSGQAQLTIANLSSKFHRSLEAPSTERLMRQILKSNSFQIHEALPGALSDEGAANHGRLCPSHSMQGIELFFYGRKISESLMTKKYFPRQTFEASQMIAQKHSVKHALYLRQSSKAIDAGVFHNDVISMAHESLYFFHEDTFENKKESLIEIQDQYLKLFKKELILEEISSKELTLENAVKSYLFNSQMITLESGERILICPSECQTNSQAYTVLKRLLKEQKWLSQVYFQNVRESMQNGGGPACLRLRLVLNQKEQKAIHSTVHLTDKCFEELNKLIQKYYISDLELNDLRKKSFLTQIQKTYRALEKYFNLKLC